jgi:hypothetical protein
VLPRYPFVLARAISYSPARATVCLALAAWDQRLWKRPGAMERRGSNHFTARHRTNLKTNANTINYSANAGRRASLGWKRPSFPLVKGPPGNPLLRTCLPRQGYGWENHTVSHERQLNHNTAAALCETPDALQIRRAVWRSGIEGFAVLYLKQ